MRHKNVLLRALLLTVPFMFGVTGCSSVQSQQPEQGNGNSMENTKPDTINFDYTQKDGEEYASVTACDKQGNIMWTYATKKYASTELTQIQEFGQTEDCYYLNESGTVISIDKNTGNILWTNSDFGGAGGDAFVDEEGTVYCCGYYGPDFCAIGCDGTTLKIIDTFDMDYIWASDIKPESDYIAVTMEAGPEEDQEGEYVFHVDPEDFSYSLYH